jgi:hypothetical protein
LRVQRCPQPTASLTFSWLRKRASDYTRAHATMWVCNCKKQEQARFSSRTIQRPLVVAVLTPLCLQVLAELRRPWLADFRSGTIKLSQADRII